MALKKSQLYSSLWNSADELRGGMDAAQYKDYVLTLGPTARKDQTIYDPTCGSGSLLLKAADQAPHGLTVYGQEKDGATWALARMNMILHGYQTAEIAKGDTITSPAFASGNQLKQHDFIVANPPFSTKSWSSGISPEADEYGRFKVGVPPTAAGPRSRLPR
jgi:type I restriction enzyme M protein